MDTVPDNVKEMCLELAVKSASPSTTPEQILDAAKLFEKYLRGDDGK